VLRVIDPDIQERSIFQGQIRRASGGCRDGDCSRLVFSSGFSISEILL
jgi:hypothetical protein